ncbi:S1 family peptidase [Microvirga flavescens]|uniref:S1 family peptidase n=1 Tax=Microvirga flavescens TaxID=2249811 RepID=UPI000DD9A2B5|nr:S1 family peptidase [Microvirga flavescens]
MRASLLISLVILAFASPAKAVLGGKTDRDPDGLRQSVVWIENSAGELCSGALLRADLVLTAAHCMMDEAKYRVVGVDRTFRPQNIRVTAAAIHPSFEPGTTPRKQPGIDLAVLKLARPLGKQFKPFDLRTIPQIETGEMVTLAGFGVLDENRKHTARLLRQTSLVSLGQANSSNKVLIVTDSDKLAQTTGLGACRGDSGGPILAATQQGYRLLGIVSWSSGALRGPPSASCGGLTAVTPLAENVPWIEKSIEVLDDL